MIIKDQLNRAYSPDMESAEKDQSKQSQTVSSIPVGGSTGQVLAKASNLDGDVVWKTSSGGAGGAVDTVNSASPDGVGNVLLDQDDILDGANFKQYSATEKTKVSKIVTTGDGSQYLANDGTYKTVSGGAGVTVYADLATLKAINTTSITTVQTVQVEGVGLYKFEPTSILYTDGLRIIQPTIGNGRWIRQSSKQRNNYKFRPIDYGSAHAYFKSKKNGRLVTGGNGAWNTDADRGIITCDELVGDNKFVKFRITSGTTYPTFFISANGSSVKTGSANFRAFLLSISETGELTICKQIGTSKTPLKTMVVGINTDIIVRKYGTKCSVSVINPIDNYFIDNFSWEDADLVNFGNTFGFSSADGKYTKFSNIEIKSLTSVGKNLIIDGDNQTSTGGIKNGQSVWQFLGLETKNKDISIQNVSYSGKKLDDTVADLANIVAKKSAVLENIYYVNLGTNDYPSDSASTMLSKLDNIISTMQTAGFKVAVSTVCLYNNASAPPANLATYNQGIRDRKTSGTIDYLFDMYESKWDIIDASFGGVYRKYTIYDDLHFSPELREKIAVGIVETLGINAMEDMAKDSLEDEFVDSIQLGEYDYEHIANSFDMRCNHSNQVAEGDRKKFINYYVDLATLKAVDTTYYTSVAYADVPTLGRYKFVLGSTDAGNDMSVITPTTGSSVGRWILQESKLVGSAIASATSITAPSTIFHVTGTTAISTITVPYTGFTGKISIIPDAVFTFTTSGNIAETYTSIINRVIELTYDGTKWYRT